jgi:hypothetical protein
VAKMKRGGFLLSALCGDEPVGAGARAADEAHIDCEKRHAMKWEVHGMRRGRPGKWSIEAPSGDIARQKAEAAGVTLGRVEPIGQITSAAVALALSPRLRPARPRRLGWIAACAACAIAFGAGGYLLGYHFAPTVAPETARALAPAASSNDPTADAVAASAVEKANDPPRNKTGPGL